MRRERGSEVIRLRRVSSPSAVVFGCCYAVVCCCFLKAQRAVVEACSLFARGDNALLPFLLLLLLRTQPRPRREREETYTTRSTRGKLSSSSSQT